MRCLVKAAALLLSNCICAFVIPERGVLSGITSDSAVDYSPDQALLKFAITTVEHPEDSPILTFQVESTDKACGESNILLNGQKLESEWDGITARGHDYLDIYGGKQAEWHVSCLYNVIPADGRNSNGDDVVHVLSLQVFDGEVHPGFTISYKQMGTPSIIRFKPRYNPTDMATLPEISSLWRIPSAEFDPDVLAKSQKDGSAAMVNALHRGQATLKVKLAAIKSKLEAGIGKVGKIFCHKANSQPKVKEPTPDAMTKISKISPIPHISSGKLLESLPNYPGDHRDHGELEVDSGSMTAASDSTSTIPIHSAATTRSLSHGPSLSPTAPTKTSVSFPFQASPLQILAKLGLILILGSFLAWAILRCRDPRRRAECLARREERRNKKLYRRAARQYKVKTWFNNRRQEIATLVWNIRVRCRLASKEVIIWDEKGTTVLEQEAVLEDIMKSDIRALRNAHRIVSDITFAEEGRSRTFYEPEWSERRRSVSTLPGYESEGSQPPTYSDAVDSVAGAMVVDGFQYTSAEAEFRSDSSVISTSPRISRDGTNSDIDEKIEPISLDTTQPAGSGLRV